MRTMCAVLLSVALLACVAQPAFSCPVIGTSANTLPRGEFMLETWGTWRNLERSYNDGLYSSGGGWIDLPDDSALSASSIVPRLYYGVTDWFTLRVALPLEDRYLNFPDDVGVETNTGLGDIVVDPKIQLYRGESGYPRVSFLTGLRFPTGDKDGVDGDGLLALSDGSTDFLVGGVVTQPAGPLMTHFCVTYWFNGTNTDNVDEKDLITATATLESPLNDEWTLLWEFKGCYGEDPTAFYRTYACPGISWRGESVTVGLSTLVSLSSHGFDGISSVDYYWAPYFKIYYRFF